MCDINFIGIKINIVSILVQIRKYVEVIKYWLRTYSSQKSEYLICLVIFTYCILKFILNFVDINICKKRISFVRLTKYETKFSLHSED